MSAYLANAVNCSDSNELELFNTVAAAVITYNPNIDRLDKCLESVSGQVRLVLIMDNDTENCLEVEDLAATYDNCFYHQNGENVGIARAINDATTLAESRGCEFLLTLDQDSVCPPGMVQEMLLGFEGPRVGLVCAYFVDTRRSMEAPSDVLPRFERVETSITSGSLCRILALRDVEGCDENLFVGSVDDDLSRALIESGWDIIRANRVLLDHELGNLTPARFHDMWLGLYRLTRIDFFRKASYRREVSPFRTYHGVRAMVYMHRKYQTGYPTKLDIAREFVMSVMRSNHKFQVLKQASRGLLDGMRVPLGRRSRGLYQ